MEITWVKAGFLDKTSGLIYWTCSLFEVVMIYSFDESNEVWSKY